MSVEKFKKKLKIGNRTLSVSESLFLSLIFRGGAARPDVSSQVKVSDLPAPLHIIETMTWENGPNVPPEENLCIHKMDIIILST